MSGWVIEQHFDSGKDLLDESDDTFPSFAKALDKGIVDKQVWWDNQNFIDRSSLAEKRVSLSSEKIKKILSFPEEVGIKLYMPPKEDSVWNIWIIDFTEVKDALDIIMEISGDLQSFE